MFLVLTIVSYFKNFSLLLSILSSISMYLIAIKIINRSNIKKADTEIKEFVRNNGIYRKLNVTPLYIMAFLFIILAFLQNINLINFSSINNLTISVFTSVYMIYENEKCHRTIIKVEADLAKARENFINKYGKEEFKRFDDNMKEFYEKWKKDFKDLYK